MNPSVNVGLDEKQQKLPRDDDRPPQKLNSALKTNVKSLKQGFRSVMNGRGLVKPTMVGPKGKEKHSNKATTPEEGDNTKTDDLNPDETIPPQDDDNNNNNNKEEEIDDVIISGSGHSLPNLQEQRDLVRQGSQSGSQELTVSPLTNERPPLSPGGATASAAGLNYPNSAPQHLGQISPVTQTPSTQVNKNNKFLRGKIKISKLKNFVGVLDLGSSNNQTGKSYQIGGSGGPRAGDDEVEDDHTRLRHDTEADDEFSSPQPMVGPGRKIAKKMRNSIFFKNLGKANRNNAPVLLGDDAVGPSIEFKSNEEDEPIKDVIDASDSDDTTGTPPDPGQASSTVPPPAPSTEQEIDQDMAAPGVITADGQTQEQEEAKQRRREKHQHRRRQGDTESESNHGSNIASAQSTTSESISVSTSGPPLQRKRTAKGKLDPHARERLKKHSEGRDFRHQDRTTNRRRRQTMAKKVSERNLLLDTSADTGTSDVPDLVPASAFKDVSRAPFARSSSEPQNSYRRPAVEPQSGRKLNKEENEKLRGRVRARQSFVAKNEEEDDDDDVSFADDIQSVSEEVEQAIEQDEGSLVEHRHEKGKQDKSKAAEAEAEAGPSSPLKPSSGHGAESGNEGSFQSVEGHRSDNYLQLVIANVPAKTPSPTPSEEKGPEVRGAPETARPSSPRREKRLVRKTSYRRSLTDPSMESSELRRTGTGSSRARAEKRGDPSSRRRKSRGEKASRPRARSARRKSDAVRRRKTKSDSVQESDPVLSAPVLAGTENDGSTTVDNASELFEQQSVNLETSSRTLPDGSSSTLDVSSKTNEFQEGLESVANLDVSAQSNDGNKEEGASGKEHRRRHHKEKRADRRTSHGSSRTTTTKQSISTTTSSTTSTTITKQPKLNRSNTAGTRDGRADMSSALKRTPSSRGRSEKSSGRRGSTEQRTRRHSKDSRNVVPEGDSKSINKPPSEAKSGLDNGGLVQIKW